MTGAVWLVGAGPGDPGLLTRRGADLLSRADAVVFDRLVSPEILELARPDAELIDVGKSSGSHPVPQEEINGILVRLAQEGKAVVRLKGGDPYLFGRGGEEFSHLTSCGVPVGVVPGITSAFGAAACGGIPLTHRDFASSVTVITCHAKRGSSWKPDWKALAAVGGTLVFLMGTSALEEIAEGLIGAGLDESTPAAVVERGGMKGERTVRGTLGSIAGLARSAGVASPALAVVGGVASLNLDFSDMLPLKDLTVVVTRGASDAPRFAGTLARWGARVLVRPSIDPRADFSSPALSDFRPGQHEWLVFTSAHGVEFFFQWLAQKGWDVRAFAGAKIAAVGPATARELEARGLIVDLVPDVFDSAHLAEALAARKTSSAAAFRAWEATDVLSREMARSGCRLDEYPLYRNEMDGGEVGSLSADWVTFASPSAVRGFVRRWKAPGARALCIGPTTAEEAQKLGFQTVTARQATFESMTAALLELARSEKAAQKERAN